MALHTHIKKAIKDIKRGFKTLATIRKGKKADKLRKKLKKTRGHKTVRDKTLRIKRKALVQRAKRFNTK